jgi:hypothetical protein
MADETAWDWPSSAPFEGLPGFAEPLVALRPRAAHVLRRLGHRLPATTAAQMATAVKASAPR